MLGVWCGICRCGELMVILYFVVISFAYFFLVEINLPVGLCVSFMLVISLFYSLRLFSFCLGKYQNKNVSVSVESFS